MPPITVRPGSHTNDLISCQFESDLISSTSLISLLLSKLGGGSISGEAEILSTISVLLHDAADQRINLSPVALSDLTSQTHLDTVVLCVWTSVLNRFQILAGNLLLFCHQQQ